MEEKQKFWKKLTAFVAGKGFYAVLALCLVVIGASAFTLVGSLRGLEGAGEVYYAGEDAAAAKTPAPAVPRTTPESARETPAVREESALPQGTEEPRNRTPEQEAPAVTEPAQQTEASSAEQVPETAEAGTAPRGWIWPVSGEVVLEYAPDRLVWNVTMADWRTHSGMDLAAPMGTRVLAVSNGTVTQVGEDDLLGTFVVVDHGEGLCSLYANLASAPAVAEGDTVEMGDVLGSVGDTALGETGEEAHLHFAMTLEGDSADPRAYLPGR